MRGDHSWRNSIIVDVPFSVSEKNTHSSLSRTFWQIRTHGKINDFSGHERRARYVWRVAC